MGRIQGPGPGLGPGLSPDLVQSESESGSGSGSRSQSCSGSRSESGSGSRSKSGSGSTSGCVCEVSDRGRESREKKRDTGILSIPMIPFVMDENSLFILPHFIPISTEYCHSL